MQNLEMISDNAKIKEIDRSKLESLATTITDFSENFSYLEGASIDLSFFNWFRVYVKSDDFKNLDSAKQDEVFSHYDNMSYVFREINEFLQINYLGMHK